MELIIQRLKSKTYHVAIAGALLTILETNSGLISQFLPVEYRNYVMLAWPVLMITLREVTTGALSDK